MPIAPNACFQVPPAPARRLRHNNPSGKIPLLSSGKSALSLCPSHPARGADRDRHDTRCGMRWTRTAAADERHRCVRRSRVVPTPRRWRQVGRRPCGAAGDGGKKARSPGRARSKSSDHRAGKAGLLPPNLYARVRFLLRNLRTRPRVRRAPGLPRALPMRGQRKARTRMRRDKAESYAVEIICSRHRPARPGDPVVQRRWRSNREAAAYGIPRLRGV